VSLRHLCLATLALQSPQQKCAATRAISSPTALTPADLAEIISPTCALPGRPAKPELVYATAVPYRSMATAEGRAALVHALAHIELNAVNIALDAIWRFADMPTQYYLDWLGVAHDEARHFTLLDSHLNKLGYQYGDFAAHNGLWDMAEQTSDDVLLRMALVPRVLEARGLDASPQVREKLFSSGDKEAAAIVDVILADEVGHVKVGNDWFGWLCNRRGCDPYTTFRALTKQFNAPRLIAPLNIDARRAAGFTEAELDDMLEQTAGKRR
jgi:uncharacterized ferritin-like protein (DUF455 family)